MSPEKPMAGYRVLDFSHAAAGPFATMNLGDLGADVIKIESPDHGDGSRYMGKPLLGPRESEYYIGLNHGKRSLLVDLKADEGRRIAHRLVGKSDVIIQNFRPGVMERLGLDFATAQRLRPGIVYCSISAFGEGGPWDGRSGNDITVQGLSGVMAMTGEEARGPVKIATAICDLTTGLFALAGILAALHVRAEHPEGQHVKVSMLDSTIAAMANYIPAIASGARARIPREGSGHAQLVPYQAFECGDGQFMIVGAFSNAFWRRLCDALGRPEWPDDERYRDNPARLANRDQLVAELTEIFRTRPRADWLAVLDAADVPSTPVLELQDTLRLEQVRARDAVVRSSTPRGPVEFAACPIRTDEWKLEHIPPPLMGQHTHEILADILGLDAEEIAELAEVGTIRLFDADNAT
jgi:crotonobetainyl-CoA:carnitine CoA-transferase CaiB-like acyl-CoA transferase